MDMAEEVASGSANNNAVNLGAEYEQPPLVLYGIPIFHEGGSV